MKNSPNGIEIPEEDYPIWQAYGFRCVIHPWKYAVCLHEEPPKSINPRWREMPWTRFPVCNQCHEDLHRMKRDVAIALLHLNQDMNYPNVKEQLCQPAES